MNPDLGYYQASVNPTYVSTWYTPFRTRVKPKPVEVQPVSLDFNEGLEGNASFVKPSRKPAQFADNKTHGRISPVALKKIKKAIDYAVYLAQPKRATLSVHGKTLQFRINFLTFTLSSQQVHSDNEIKKQIFQPMLNALRQKYHVVNYIWRGEKQANGNLHFHVVTDQFIRWNDLRNDWNKFQQNLGYVTRYRQNQEGWHSTGFRVREDMLKHWPVEAQKKAYIEGIKCEWCNPNSTDVHALKHVSNVKQYFVKYLTKDTQSLDKGPVQGQQYSNMEGRLWGCSEGLSKILGGRADVDSGLTEELFRMSREPDVKHFSDEFHSVTFVNIETLIARGYVLLPGLLEAFIRVQFPSYRPPGLFDSDPA